MFAIFDALKCFTAKVVKVTQAENFILQGMALKHLHTKYINAI